MTSAWLCATPIFVAAHFVFVPLSSECEAILGSFQALHGVKLHDYLLLLGATLSLELPLWALWAKLTHSPRVFRTTALALSANLVSHPTFVFLWLRLAYKQRWPVAIQLGAGELIVIFLETFLLRQALGSLPRALLASALINAFSWTVGLWLQAVR